MKCDDDNEDVLQAELERLEHEEEVQKRRRDKLTALKAQIEDKKKVVSDLKGRFHQHLSDVGLYSVGGLAAVSLLQLFDEDCHAEFKKTALKKILEDLNQPKTTNESMMAILDGEIMDQSDVFVDSLLGDPALKDDRQPLIVDLITIAISDGCYDSRMRVLIKHMAWQLRVTWDEVEEIETDLAETIEYHAYVMTEEEEKEKAKKSRNRKVKRYALIGLATVGGGALIGLTGGLAAPLVAAGAGAIIGGAGAAALGSAAGVAIIGSLFGVAGAGLTGYKMKRRVGAVEEFAFEPLTLIGSKYDRSRTVKQLHITIAVTGWLDDRNQEFRVPWSALAESKEQYSLRWESKYLYQLGEAFDYILSTGISIATTEALKYTILAGLITAIAWPAALISAAGTIDNPWHVCTQRATEAGKQLAEVLLGREQGNRPVTLIGFSMGSRVIFACLEEMAKRKGGEGLIEDVILLGAPVSGDPKHWQPFSRIVAGKIVNGYSRGDWLLKFLFRTASVTLKVAGLGPVKWDNRRMHNIDLTDIIDGHGDYIKNLDTILKAVGVRTKDEVRSKSTSKSSSMASVRASDSTSSIHDKTKAGNDDGGSTSKGKTEAGNVGSASNGKTAVGDIGSTSKGKTEAGNVGNTSKGKTGAGNVTDTVKAERAVDLGNKANENTDEAKDESNELKAKLENTRKSERDETVGKKEEKDNHEQTSNSSDSHIKDKAKHSNAQVYQEDKVNTQVDIDMGKNKAEQDHDKSDDITAADSNDRLKADTESNDNGQEKTPERDLNDKKSAATEIDNINNRAETDETEDTDEEDVETGKDEETVKTKGNNETTDTTDESHKLDSACARDPAKSDIKPRKSDRKHKRRMKINKGAINQMKADVKDSVTDAIKCVKSNVKSTVKETLRKKEKGSVAFKTANEEVSVDKVNEPKDVEAESTDDEEGCYFTDSNPEDEVEANDDDVKQDS